MPRELAENLELRRGDYMAIVVLGDRMLMRRIQESAVLDRDNPNELQEFADAQRELNRA